jgi:hypothetical protein
MRVQKHGYEMHRMSQEFLPRSRNDLGNIPNVIEALVSAKKSIQQEIEIQRKGERTPSKFQPVDYLQPTLYTPSKRYSAATGTDKKKCMIDPFA